MKVGLFAVLVVVTLAGCQQPPMATPKFQIVPVADGGAWKIDTQSGTTWFCTNKMLSTDCRMAKDQAGF